MEVAKQKVRVAAARNKEEEKTKVGESSSTPKVVSKGATKRKNDRKEDHQSKKAFVIPAEKIPKKPSPLKHGAGKGLMTTPGPVTQDSERRLLTHKDYVVEMRESIIKEKDADPCASQATGELGDSGLFDLARVGIFYSFFYLLISMLVNWQLLCPIGPGSYEGSTGQVRGQWRGDCPSVEAYKKHDWRARIVQEHPSFLQLRN